MSMDNGTKRQLEIMSCKIRMGTVIGTYNAKSGHPGGSLSIADLLAYLYTCRMRVDPKNPQWEDRDRLVLSKGHAAPALYSALAIKGFFSFDELKNLRHIGSMLQGHPDMTKTPGVDMSTGSLGQGISAACGMALGGKMSKKDFSVYAILGDGEIQEGQVWEAAMFASHKKLGNLIAFIDNNNLQIDGTVEEVNSPYPIGEKFSAFGWKTYEINAHDFDGMERLFKEIDDRKDMDKPVAVVIKSVKGKGVSFMEDQLSWHGKGPNKEQYEAAMEELKKELAKLEDCGLCQK